MSFLQRVDSSKHRKLTEKQEKFLDALSGEASGDIKTALQIAGYEDTSYYAVVKSLRQEIIDTANTILAQSAPRAAQKLVQVLESDKPIPQVNAKLHAAQTLLDRVGVAKRDKLDVTHNAGTGIFILPEKKPTIEAEDVEVIDEEKK